VKVRPVIAISSHIYSHIIVQEETLTSDFICRNITWAHKVSNSRHGDPLSLQNTPPSFMAFFDLEQLPLEMLNILYEEDFSERENGDDIRRYADCLLKAVLAAPSPWSYGRHFVWHVYTDTLSHYSDIVNESDKKACLKMLHNKEEPVLYRASAAFAIAHSIISETGSIDFELIADYYRQVIEIGQSMPAEDVDRPILTNHEDRLFSTAGEQVKGWVDAARANLRYIMNPQERDRERERDPEYQRPMYNFNMLKHIPLDVRTRCEFGGNACDCCGKTLEQLGVARLDVCSVCKHAYFCSSDCQRKQWKAGHKDACRKPGEIKAGDWMRLRGLQSKPEWDGRLVTTCHVDPAKPTSRWIVCFPWAKEKEMSVANEKLTHIRPAK
jgi:MYND finger